MSFCYVKMQGESVKSIICGRTIPLSRKAGFPFVAKNRLVAALRGALQTGLGVAPPE